VKDGAARRALGDLRADRLSVLCGDCLRLTTISRRRWLERPFDAESYCPHCPSETPALVLITTTGEVIP
jgi:hypothetical protein